MNKPYVATWFKKILENPRPAPKQISDNLDDIMVCLYPEKPWDHKKVYIHTLDARLWRMRFSSTVKKFDLKGAQITIDSKNRVVYVRAKDKEGNNVTIEFEENLVTKMWYCSTHRKEDL